MRIRMLLVCFLSILVSGGLLWFLSRSPNHRINDEGYHDLLMGMEGQDMTELDVIRVLGVPAGDYGPGKGEILESGFITMTSHMIRTDPNGKKWLAGDFAITVCFDENGRVRGLGTDSVYRPYDSFWEMFWQGVGLKKKKPYPAWSLNALLNK